MQSRFLPLGFIIVLVIIVSSCATYGPPPKYPPTYRTAQYGKKVDGNVYDQSHTVNGYDKNGKRVGNGYLFGQWK